jgi:hypothetical protein
MAARFPNKAYLAKQPSKVQSEFAAWIEKTTGHVVPEGDVALVQRLYPLYLKTPEVVKARDAATAEREKEAAAREQRVREAKADRLRKAEEQAARLRRELGIDTDDETGPAALSVVPATVDEDDDDDSETTDHATGLVLGAPTDEFVEVTPEEDDTDVDTVDTDADGDPVTEDTDDDDLWDADTDDDGEADF